MNTKNLDFNEVYELFQPRVLRFFTRMFRDGSEAEDLTQEAFIKVSSGLKNFRGDSGLYTWIYKIAANVARDRFRSALYRKNNKNAPISIDHDLQDKNIWTGDQAPRADQQMVKDEMNACIQGYLYELNEDYRTVLVLSEYEGLKNKEIAEILGMSLDIVKIRLHRGRAKLKKRMEAGCDLYYDDNGNLSCDQK